MLCSVITENSNWEILTKNLVTFQRYNRAKDEDGLGQFADLRESSARKWVVFLRGVC